MLDLPVVLQLVFMVERICRSSYVHGDLRKTDNNHTRRSCCCWRMAHSNRSCPHCHSRSRILHSHKLDIFVPPSSYTSILIIE